jgi:hypothetical protein
MVEVEAKPTNLERLAAALVLTRVDPSIELLKHLVVASEWRPIEHLGGAKINRALDRTSDDYNALGL